MYAKYFTKTFPCLISLTLVYVGIFRLVGSAVMRSCYALGCVASRRGRVVPGAHLRRLPLRRRQPVRTRPGRGAAGRRQHPQRHRHHREGDRQKVQE